jgi:long-chain acyl-CoA synthetase
MLYIPNCPQWIIANFAINKIGAVMVPVSPIYTAFEIGYMIEDADIKTVICLDTNFGYIKEVMKTTRLERVIVTNIVEFIPLWKQALGHLFNKIPTGKIEKGKEIFSFGKLVRENSPKAPKVEIDVWKDLSYIMYTGGTTGFPKGVPGNHMGEVSYIRDVMEDVIDGHMQETKEVVLMINPLFHIMAKGFTIAFGFNFGNTVILMPSPEIDATLKAIERYKVGWMLGVPALYRMMLENDRLDQYDLSSLKYCYCGGDVLPGEVYRTYPSTRCMDLRRWDT